MSLESTLAGAEATASSWLLSSRISKRETQTNLMMEIIMSDIYSLRSSTDVQDTMMSQGRAGKKKKKIPNAGPCRPTRSGNLEGLEIQKSGDSAKGHGNGGGRNLADGDQARQRPQEESEENERR